MFKIENDDDHDDEDDWRQYLDTHYRGDGGGAGGALVFCSPGNKDCGIVGDGGNYGSKRCPGMSLVIDVGVGKHRGASPPDPAVGTGIRLGKYSDDPLEVGC